MPYFLGGGWHWGGAPLDSMKLTENMGRELSDKNSHPNLQGFVVHQPTPPPAIGEEDAFHISNIMTAGAKKKTTNLVTLTFCDNSSSQIFQGAHFFSQTILDVSELVRFFFRNMKWSCRKKRVK